MSLALSFSLTALPFFSASAAGKNIALDGYAEVDSVHRQYPEHVGSNINDGNMSTRWQSNSAMTSGDPCIGGIFWHEYYSIDSIIIYWETSRPLETGYTIEVSDDCGYTWRRADFTVSARVEIPNGDKSIYKDEITVTGSPVVNAVRAVCTQGAPFDDGTGAKDAASIFEFEVYGNYVKSAMPSFNGLTNISYDADVEVDSVSVEYPGHKASYLNDGNMRTRWQSNSAMTVDDPCWVEMYWDMTYEIKAIGIYWENSRPDLDGYSIEYSDDGGKTWKSRGFDFNMRLKGLSVMKPDGSGTETQHLDSFYTDSKIRANAIRICCLMGEKWDENGTRKDQASIFELEVYAVPGSGVPNEKDDVSSNVSSNVSSSISSNVSSSISSNVSSSISSNESSSISSESVSSDVSSESGTVSDASSDTVTSFVSSNEMSSTTDGISSDADGSSHTSSDVEIVSEASAENGTSDFETVVFILLSVMLAAAVAIVVFVVIKTSR